MKIRLYIKDPDGIGDCIHDAVLQSMDDLDLMNDREREALSETREESICDAIEKWVEDCEYVAIEIDTSADTARVLKTSEW